MASTEFENAQLFKFAESHQAVVLHPTAPGMRLTMEVDNSCHRVRSRCSK